MEDVTISKAEYQRLKQAMQMLKAMQDRATIRKATRRKFDHAAFGALKGMFGKESSVAYVRKFRKQWRA